MQQNVTVFNTLKIFVILTDLSRTRDNLVIYSVMNQQLLLVLPNMYKLFFMIHPNKCVSFN